MQGRVKEVGDGDERGSRARQLGGREEIERDGGAAERDRLNRQERFGAWEQRVNGRQVNRPQLCMVREIAHVRAEDGRTVGVTGQEVLDEAGVDAEVVTARPKAIVLEDRVVPRVSRVADGAYDDQRVEEPAFDSTRNATRQVPGPQPPRFGHALE